MNDFLTVSGCMSVLRKAKIFNLLSVYEIISFKREGNKTVEKVKNTPHLFWFRYHPFMIFLAFKKLELVVVLCQFPDEREHCGGSRLGNAIIKQLCGIHS